MISYHSLARMLSMVERKLGIKADVDKRGSVRIRSKRSGRFIKLLDIDPDRVSHP